MASIKDVAKLAGVSSATVSRVLSNKPHVRPEVKERVYAAVDEIGYRPNRVASSLRKQSTSLIGLLVSDIRTKFFTDIARAIEDSAHQHGLSVFLCNTDEDPEKEWLYLNTLLNEQVAGIILSPTSTLSTRFELIEKSNIPIVTIDRRIENYDVDAVLTDNEDSTFRLTKHLVENGYSQIGAVIGLQGSTTGRQRMRGYRNALAESGLNISDSLMEYENPTEEGGYIAGMKFLQRANRPDAIISGNSRLTLGLLDAVRELGLSIPDDVALAGFDETNWMPHVTGGVTVVSQPAYEMGETAAELLLKRIGDMARPSREIVLKSKLITRASSKK